MQCIFFLRIPLSLAEGFKNAGTKTRPVYSLYPFPTMDEILP